MSLLEDCQKHFSSRDLYQIIGVEKSATPSQIKRAYYKLSLKVHPDRVGEVCTPRMFAMLACYPPLRSGYAMSSRFNRYIAILVNEYTRYPVRRA